MINPPKPAPTTSLSSQTAPQQLSIAFDSIPLQAMSSSERAKVLMHLANLLMLAAGATGGYDDDQR